MSRDYRKILRARPRWQCYGWLLPSIALVTAVWMSGLAVHASGQAQVWQLALDAARSRSATRPAPSAPTRVVVEEKRRWDALAAEFAFSWYPLFRALEQASSPEIELLEFLPDKAGRRLTLRGEARNIGALSAYMTALGAQPSLMEIYLAQQKNVGRGGMTLLSFEVRARLDDTRGNQKHQDITSAPKN